MPKRNRLQAVWCRLHGHRWEYGGTGDWTGYVEVCDRCGEIVQVVQ